MHNRVVRALTAGLAGVALSGCVVAPGSAGVNGHYLGYVRLKADEATNGGRVSDVDTLGAWLEPGSRSGAPTSVGLGFRRAEQVAVPLDCRIAVIVRSEAQMAEARALVQSLEGRQACAVNAVDH
ncbi:MAG: hypothetical protein EON85_08905 [Brevundimonas sp.]|nr:MAG: hypothetical protein EON85_08905 [Brevundimonas sp.]